MLCSAASSMTKYFFRIKQIVRKVNVCFGLCCKNRDTPAPLSPMILSYGESGTSVPFSTRLFRILMLPVRSLFLNKLLFLRQILSNIERRGDEDDDTDGDILCIGIHTEIL